MRTLRKARQLRGWRAAFVGGLCAAALVAVIVPVAYATVPGDGGGGYLSCSNHGVTPGFGGQHEESSGPCSTFLVKFKAEASGHPCGLSTYNITIVNIPEWTQAWYAGGFCQDGVWHQSTVFGQNHNRLVYMRINGNNVSWYIQQYRIA